MAAGRGWDRVDILKREAGLQYGTIGWHLVAAIAAIPAGGATGSISLIAFGIDSGIQALLAGMLLWRIRFDIRGRSGDEKYGAFKRRALFGIGIAFFLLALYILNESGSQLYYKEKPATSVIGLVLSILSFIVMAVLSVLKLRAAKVLESRMLRSDAAETAVRSYPPFVLFFGLWLHAGPGWWWADAVAALFMLPLIVREGWKAVEGSKGTSYDAESTKMIL